MIKPSFDRLIYAAVVALCLIVLILAALAQSFDSNTNLIYQGF